jgi:hypothetical protein
MTRIGIISDTHSWLDEAAFTHFQHCDEIWHAGDFGTMEVAEQLQNFRPLKGVWGNIDDAVIRHAFPETLRWRCEDVEVVMTHIGGYPGKYAPAIRKTLQQNPPQLFICGHSHILKIMYDDKLRCLHINPGAAGRQGWHKVRTLVLLTIDGSTMKDCKVVELGGR